MNLPENRLRVGCRPVPTRRRAVLPRFLPFLLALLFLAPDAPCAKLGDLNDDGRWDEKDMEILLNHLLDRDESDTGTLNLNTDEALDAGDVVTLADIISSYSTRVDFDDNLSTVTEDAGAIEVPIVFSDPLEGTIEYEIYRMTTAGPTDFQSAVDAVTSRALLSVDGTTASIPITVLDDMEIEDIEMIVIDLYPYPDGVSAGYRVGGVSRHVLLIFDDDRQWTGVLKRGFSELVFRMNTRQTPTSSVAALVCNLDPGSPGGVVGAGTIPEGEWPMSLVYDDERFEAQSGFIPMGRTPLFDNAEFTRRLTFHARKGEEFYTVRRNIVLGEYTDEVKPGNPNLEYLETTTTGVLVLIPDRPIFNFPDIPKYAPEE